MHSELVYVPFTNRSTGRIISPAHGRKGMESESFHEAVLAMGMELTGSELNELVPEQFTPWSR